MTIERRAEIRTGSGEMGTFLYHPREEGPHPVIIFLMDSVGMRQELRDMARRLAGEGYYVMLPNLYYRSGEEDFGLVVEGSPILEHLYALMDSLTLPLILSDTESLIAYADADPAAAGGPVGCVGYCMSGQFAINAAAHCGGRVAAAASFYGVRLVTDETKSPHLAGEPSPHITAGRAKGALYFGWAEFDEYAPQEWIEPIRQSMAAGKVDGEIELYRGADHGFAFPNRATYDHAAAEHHWQRLFELFDRALR